MKDRDMILRKEIGFVLKPGQSAKLMVVDLANGQIIKESEPFHHADHQRRERLQERIQTIVGGALILVLIVLWFLPSF